mmetsp:Transcript_15463/g.29252  ORF Transcript_15463/g.29252 Transcript_15463/m.29252 type:complete len:233 (+) Transcript_15463:361-1059(+)
MFLDLRLLSSSSSSSSTTTTLGRLQVLVMLDLAIFLVFIFTSILGRMDKHPNRILIRNMRGTIHAGIQKELVRKTELFRSSTIQDSHLFEFLERITHRVCATSHAQNAAEFHAGQSTVFQVQINNLQAAWTMVTLGQPFLDATLMILIRGGDKILVLDEFFVLGCGSLGNAALGQAMIRRRLGATWNTRFNRSHVQKIRPSLAPRLGTCHEIEIRSAFLKRGTLCATHVVGH